MLTIYHSKQSRSMRVVWLCEELGIDYAVSPLAMFTPEMKTRDYLAIHPLGKVPAIDDGGFVLWETSAILQYLNARYADGQWLPSLATDAGALAIQWLEYGENPLTSTMGEIAAHGGALPKERRIPALVERGRELAPTLVGIVEGAIGDREWILGDAFSAAAFPGMEEQVKQNMAMFQKTMQMFNPFVQGAAGASEEAAPGQQDSSDKPDEDERNEELQTLRDQLQTMQAQINKLAENSN